MRKKFEGENAAAYREIDDIAESGASTIGSMGSQKKTAFSLGDLLFVPAQISKIPLNSDQPVNTSLKDVTIATSSYQTIANLYNSSILRNRVMSAIMTQCSSVFLEGSGATNHANRMKLVNLANVNLPLVVSQFMSAIALNATIQAAGTACTDANILSVISGAWDSYASLIIA